jgi:hypothetical protein
MIERQIIIGLITSTEFIQHIHVNWDNSLLESKTAQRLALWCMEYFEKYKRAPGKDIESIYFEKLRTGDLPKDLGEDIEEILEDLSEEYEERFNLEYTLDRTSLYLKERQLEKLSETIKDLIASGETAEAERITKQYKAITAEITHDLDLSNVNTLLKVENAFNELYDPVLYYPGALGDFMNRQLTRGSFVAFLASEKRGKSFWLLDMAIRASKQKAKVAFFQAGDMTENQQLKRVGIYLTKKPDDERYTGDMYLPVTDCMFNQLDQCDKDERECDFGVFEKSNIKSIKKEITLETLKKAYKNEPRYSACHNCLEFKKHTWGVPWIKKIKIKETITPQNAKDKIQQFFIDKKRKFKLSTHPNGSLTVDKIKQILERWEGQENFVPDMIVIDYADLLVTNKTKEFRHQQDTIWRELRSLNQEKNCLLVTATQADAKSYEKETLSLSNFSEDKRKYAHVTAMYGLNQDKDGREKQIGVLRINELVKREGGFDTSSIVTVLQRLELGRPFLGSYY